MLNAQELEDLMDEVTHRLSKANIDGTLMMLLGKLGWESILAPELEPLFTLENGKILVIGEQTVAVEQLKMTAKNYERAQTYVYSKLAYNSNYRAILVGAVPHSTTGTGQSGSLLAELQKHTEKYPRTVALRTEEGKLKITKSGFKRALQQLIEDGYLVA